MSLTDIFLMPSGQQGVHKWWAEQQFLPDSRHDWGGGFLSPSTAYVTTKG